MFTFGISVITAVGFYKVILYLCSRFLEAKESTIEKFSAWSAFIFFVLIYYGSGYYGFKKPGMIFERNSYQAIVELHVKRNGEEFLAQGKIESGIGKVYTETQRYYSLKYFDLPNGRRISFNKAYGEDLQLENYVRISDDQDRYWEIKLQPVLKGYLWMNR